MFIFGCSHLIQLVEVGRHQTDQLISADLIQDSTGQFQSLKKCQRSVKGQSTMVENELYKRVLVTRGPALTPGCHKH